MNYSFIVTLASITGVVANIHKKRWCFFIWIFTNGFWCIYDFTLKAYSQSLLFFVYLILAIWGIVKWRKEIDDNVGKSN